MLPALVLSFATLCAMVVFLIYIVIVGIYFLDAFQYQIDEFLRELQFDLKVNATHVWWGVLVIFIIYTGLYGPTFLRYIHSFHVGKISFSF